MSKTPALWPYSMMGYVMRAMRIFPASWRERLLRRLVNKEATNIPSFFGMLRFLEAAGTGSLPGIGHRDLLRTFPELDSVTTTDVAIPGPHGTVNGRLYRGARNSGSGGFVWVHGGAFVGGDIDGTEAHWPALALAEAGIPVLSLGYRKALRGVHYPVPSDDILAGWNWANTNLARFGSGIETLHLGGASAGANLTAGVCKRLRDGGGAAPRSLVLVYPLIHAVLPDDPPGTLAALQQRAPGVFMSQAWIDDCVLNYVGDPALLSDPYAVPALGFVGNQPPVLIINCEVDSLRVSGEDYARRLQDAGVTVRVESLHAAFHGCLSDPRAEGAVHCLSLMRKWLMTQVPHPN
jgi:acetyl esterase